MNYARISDITRELATLIRPPRRVRVSESAHQHVKVYDGQTWDYWDPTATPYMMEPMDTLASRHHEAVIFCGPSRTGKSAALLDGWIGHAAVNDPGDMALYFPDGMASADYGRANVQRMHEESPSLKALLSPRAHDSNISTVKYRHGMILRLLYPTSSKLSRITLKSVGLTEYDSFPDSAGKDEGATFWLAKKRVQNAMSAGMAMAESSPKRPITDPRWIARTPHEAPPTAGGILQLYNQGDRRRWYWRCLDCAGRFEVPALPSYDDLPDIETAAVTASVVCPHCGAIHRQEHRRDLNLSGVWIPEWFVVQAGRGDPLRNLPTIFAPRNPIASFWLRGCAAAFQSWPALVANYLRAKREFERSGDEEALKTTCNVDQGIPYLPAALQSNRSLSSLLACAEDFERAVVPEGARFIVVTVDTQKRHFVVQVHAFGVGGETWIIDRYTLTLSERTGPNHEPEPIDPALYDEDWKLLATKVLTRTYPLADGSGRHMPVKWLGVDSGGEEGVSERAYAFWRWAKRESLGNRVFLLRGDKRATDHSPIVDLRYPDMSGTKRKSSLRGDVPLYFVNGVRLGDTMYADLDKNSGPGAIHYADWLGEDAIEQLAAEVRRNGRWEKVSAGVHNETPDLIRYARALLYVAQCNVMDGRLIPTYWGERWERCREWAREWEANPTIFQPQAPDQQEITVVRKTSGPLSLADIIRGRMGGA